MLGEGGTRAVERAPNDVVHIVVAIFREAAAEDGAVFFFCQGGVTGIERLVFGVVDGIVGFLARVPVRRVFSRDVGDGLRAELEVFVFDDARVGNLAGRVVHHGDALMVFFLETFCFEAEAAVGERAERVAEICVDCPCVDDRARGVAVALPYGGEVVVFARAHLDAVEQGMDEAVVAADGDALVAVVEVVVVEGVADGQAADDEGGQLRAAASPLLLGVALDELRVDVRSDERDGLFLEVLRLLDAGSAALFFDLCRSFRRRCDAPHFRKGVHVEREVVEFSAVVRDGGVDVVVERYETVDIVPDFTV